MDIHDSTLAVEAPACDLRLHAVRPDPFPHVICDGFIEPERYRQLCRTFPQCQPGKSPTGYSLYWGDEGYERLLDEQPVWRELRDTFHSQTFLEWGFRQFAEVWKRQGLTIDPAAARYVPYREDRVEKERTSLGATQHEPHELHVRMDIHQGRVGYSLPAHFDYPRRLVSMLIYLCDHDENRMVGGELCLHGEKLRRDPVRVAPKHNRMVAFPCANDSLHSVARLTQAQAPRNYLHVFISSSAEIWPRDATPPLWRRALLSTQRLFTGAR